jgi:hypothetical protein
LTGATTVHGVFMKILNWAFISILLQLWKWDFLEERLTPPASSK